MASRLLFYTKPRFCPDSFDAGLSPKPLRVLLVTEGCHAIGENQSISASRTGLFAAMANAYDLDGLRASSITAQATVITARSMDWKSSLFATNLLDFSARHSSHRQEFGPQFAEVELKIRQRDLRRADISTTDGLQRKPG